MLNNCSLIPARFLILVGHLIICIVLIWNHETSVRTCSTETEISEDLLDSHHTQWLTGFSLMIMFLCFEMLAFVCGLTMFHNDSALLYIGVTKLVWFGHSSIIAYLNKIFRYSTEKSHPNYDTMKSSKCTGINTLTEKNIENALHYSVDISVETPGWSKLLILAGVSTTVGLSVPVGYNIGVVNTPAEIIKAFCNDSLHTRFDTELSKNSLELIWSSIVSVFLVGAAVGSLGGSILADKIGRKGVVILCTLLAAVGAAAFWITKVANSLELLFLGRILVGLSAGLTTSVVPMYLTELAPLHLRGATGVLCPLGVTIGVLLGQIVSLHDILGNEDFWPYCLAAVIVPVSVSALALPFLPESPKYLFVTKKQPHIALQQLQKIRNIKKEYLNQEIEELKLEQQENDRNAGNAWNILRVLSDKSLLLPLVLVCSLQGGQQLSGINAVFLYSNIIFKEAGLSSYENELATIGTGICNMFMGIVSIYVMSRFNRRLCIQISLLSSAFFLVMLGIAIIYIKSYTWVPYLSIVGVLGYVLCYGFGLGPIPYFVGSELFEVGPRPSAMALGSMSNWGFNFVVGLTFPLLQSCIGASSFFIFASLVILLFVLVKFYLPETRGRDVTEIVESCRDGFSSRPLKKRETTRQNTDNAEKTYASLTV